jgi:hypothetical protein
MERTISIKIDNLIQNYCYNFLSYLYANSGWKRTALETSKENFIPSFVADKKIRILISNTGSILLTCYCFSDILTSMEYLYSQFAYGRMEYYLVHTDINIRYTVTEKYILEQHYYDKEIEYRVAGGTIVLNGNTAILSYQNVEESRVLFEIFRDIFYTSEEDVGEDVQEIEKEIVEEITEKNTENTEEITEKNTEVKNTEEKNIEDESNESDDKNAEKYLYSFLMLFSMIKLMQFV